MIGYTTLGTNDLARATEFYQPLMEELGANQFMQNERMVMWGTTPGQGMLAICTPWDEGEASVGNGVMVALNAGSKEKVDRIHAKALELGGSDEGAPGPRGDGGFYGGYFRDPDGNKLVAFTMG